MMQHCDEVSSALRKKLLTLHEDQNTDAAMRKTDRKKKHLLLDEDEEETSNELLKLQIAVGWN